MLIDLEMAQKLVGSAREKASEMGARVSIAVGTDDVFAGGRVLL